MIPFNKPPFTGNEEQYVLHAMQSDKISGDGFYGKRCQAWFEGQLHCQKALLTPSCTAALEMAAILIDIQPGDEVIMPSYTFVSSANAFVLRGAKIVFIDIRPDTMNIDETLIEAAITPKTKAVVPVHYAGVSCEMDVIQKLADSKEILLVEDAAQGMMSTYKGKALGTIGHLGTYSFHETKNYTSGGEGGLLIINDECFLERAEIIREKGTNRSQFFRGQVDKYTWQDIGSSCLPGELIAAFLWAQLEEAEWITSQRLEIWENYHRLMEPLETEGYLRRPIIPEECGHNGHIYYVLLAGEVNRQRVLEHLNEAGVNAIFHYVPLHSSPSGKRFGRAHSDLKNTEDLAERLIRLPIWIGLNSAQQERVVSEIKRAMTSF